MEKIKVKTEPEEELEGTFDEKHREVKKRPVSQVQPSSGGRTSYLETYEQANPAFNPTPPKQIKMNFGTLPPPPIAQIATGNFPKADKVDLTGAFLQLSGQVAICNSNQAQMESVIRRELAQMESVIRRELARLESDIKRELARLGAETRDLREMQMETQNLVNGIAFQIGEPTHTLKHMDKEKVPHSSNNTSTFWRKPTQAHGGSHEESKPSGSPASYAVVTAPKINWATPKLEAHVESTPKAKPVFPQCVFCGRNNHIQDKCLQVRTSDDRRDFIISENRCFKCLGINSDLERNTHDECKAATKSCRHCKTWFYGTTETHKRYHHPALCPRMMVGKPIMRKLRGHRGPKWTKKKNNKQSHEQSHEHSRYGSH